MRRRSFLSAAAFGAGVSLTGPISGALATGLPPQLASDEIEAIRILVRNYYQQRATAITRESAATSVAKWQALGTPEFVSRIDADVAPLFAGRDLAVRAHGGYTRAETEVDLTVRAMDGRELVLDVTERTKLYFAGLRPAAGPASAYRIHHEVRLVKAGANRWLLAGARFLPKGALPPLTQDTGGVLRSSKVPGDQAVAALGPAASTVPDVESARAAAARRSRAAADLWDHQAMVDYSIYFWDLRNPSYPDYHDHGGDCTNFVSQIVKVGGWQEVGPPGQATRSKWFHGRTVDECSFTWGGANNFHSFAVNYSGRMKLKERVYDLQDSSIVQYDFGGDGTIDHTQFVTDNVYDEKTVELYMTQHDDDYLMRPLTEILARIKQSNPNFKTYAMTYTTW